MKREHTRLSRDGMTSSISIPVTRLLQKFKEEQKNAEVNVERLLAGETIGQKKRKVEQANKLFDVVESSKDSMLTYLKAGTYSLCVVFYVF